MANEMQGMFGQDPALVQQALRQQQDAGIAQQAQMDPWSAVAYGAGTGASRLAGGIGGMLGYEDPQVKQANTIKRVQEESMAEAKAMGIDPAKDMEKFGEIVSNKYNMYGMPDKAFGVQQIIQGMKAQQADIGLKQAKAAHELKKAQAETDPIQKMLIAGKLTPKDYQEYKLGNKTLGELELYAPTKYDTVTTAEGVFRVDKTDPSKMTRIGSPFATTNIDMGGTKDYSKVLNLREKFLSEAKPLEKNLTLLDEAIQVAKDAATSPVAAKALPNVLAKYFGDAENTANEIKRMSSIGNVYERALGSLSRGVLGTETEEATKAVLETLYKHRTANQNKRRVLTSQYNKFGDLKPEEREFITGGFNEQDKAPMPSVLVLNGKQYTDVTPANITSIIKNSGMSKEEQIQWLEYGIKQGWDK